MTCYETLRAPAPAVDAPMAHHFVKWWRNKFRNGYKKFSLINDGERTDTEELIGRAASQCSAPPDLLPSEARALLQPSSPPPRRAPPLNHPPSPPLHPKSDHDKPTLRFEELTCDVELQHPESSKQQPLQFSFTLYDLDGHGRMTKDDIAGIVSTIYESIGKSVTVPHYGSKTIQVRLTVVPEDGSGKTKRERQEERQEKRREERREERRHRRREQAANTKSEVQEVEPSEDEQRGRLSADDDASSKSSCSAERRPRAPPPPPRARHHRHSRKEQREARHAKKRSGSLQRRELLEIIQANMEKNRLTFQTSRKTNEPTIIEEELTPKYQKHRKRSHTISEKPAATTFHKAKESNGNGYLDLANIGDSNLCRYDRYLHAVICSSAKHAHSGYHHKPGGARARAPHAAAAVRSRSHDTPHKPSQPHPRVLQIIFL